MLYEIIDEEGIVRSYKLLTRPRPIIKKREFRQGDKAPDFTIAPGDVVWASAPLAQGRWLHSHELTHRPLIVAFFCTGWGTYNHLMIDKLRTLHHLAQQAGTSMLVLTQTPPQELKTLVEQYEIDFNIGYDKNNRIARNFGVYDANYPVWDRVAGINEDVLTPGIFVINSQEKFLFAQIDKDFEMEWDDLALQNALPSAASEANRVKFA